MERFARPVRAMIVLLCSFLILVGSKASGQTDPVCSTNASPEDGAIAVSGGVVRGIQRGNSRVFLGIPYAAPPVGDLRFRPPQPPACFNTILDASNYSPMCPQMDAAGTVLGDENCLALNVWAPAGASPGSTPVVVFLHGGGNLQGSSSDQWPDGTFAYDGQALSEEGNLVVVTLNYRLGILGFLSLPQLDAESSRHVSGNYGLLDQLAALAWVQRNIASFGGDRSKVLLFGQSAGGQDVCDLLTSPLAAGLFSAALTESGVCMAQTSPQAQTIGTQVVVASGCAEALDVPDCLRSKAAAELIAARPGNTNLGLKPGDYQPVVDGYVLPASPFATIQRGRHNQVPLIVGANAAETDQMVPTTIVTGEEYRRFVGSLYPSFTEAIFSMYPTTAYPSPRDAAVAVSTDARFVCPARLLVRTAAAHQAQPVFRYHFTHSFDLGGGETLGPVHGLELLFVFDRLGAGAYVPTQSERSLANGMIGYWSRLAGSGDPNGPGGVSWPRSLSSQDLYLQLDASPAAREGIRTAQCDFWDKLTNAVPSDTTAPDTLLTGGSLNMAGRAATISFAATEAGSTFECQLDGSSFAPCISPISYSALGLGSHTFRVRATDPAGNTDPTPASYSWMVDITPPLISGLQVIPGGSGTAAIQWTTNEPSSSRVDYGNIKAKALTSIQDGVMTSTHRQVVTGLAPNTTYYYRVTSVDAAGNVALFPPVGTIPASFTCPKSGC